MALGGGTFVTQNKILPGAYINFVSAARASAGLASRGVATMPLALDWGAQNEIIELNATDFPKACFRALGYDYAAPELRGLRDLFKNTRLVYLYRLGIGGAKAENEYGTARYAGARGNVMTLVINENPDDGSKMDVYLYMDGIPADHQTVQAMSDLVDNDFVVWNREATLSQTAGMPFSGGVSPSVTNADYQTYLEAIESYSFNAIGCPSSNAVVKGFFTAFTKRMRDEQGIKFQCVSHDFAADYEGAVNVMNNAGGAAEWSLVYWVTGVVAGTEVNKSALNRVYDGEYEVDVRYTQSQLESAILSGKFAFHRAGSDIRVLSDINSLITLTQEKGEIFKENQTIRVIDQIANDIAVLFNVKYLGTVPNDADGRVSLWADIVSHHEQLQAIRAIENFSGEDVQVSQGETKRSVVVNAAITVVNAMAQLYMAVTIA
jgi:hypothetical protein